MNSYTFTKDILGLTMWSKFSEIFRLIDEGHKRILVRSANGVGKTTALAALCNWKLHQNNECIVLTTSSSHNQVRHNLWGEIRRQASRTGLYEPREITDTRIKLDDKRFMIAVNPARPESAQGFHAASILIAVDEATAVRRDVIESLIATATGDDVQIVMIYNPMSTDSFVYDAERSGEWKLVTISALEHPNVVERRTIIPGAVTYGSTLLNFSLWSEPSDTEAEGTVFFDEKYWRQTCEVSRRIVGRWHDDTGEGLIPRAHVNSSLAVPAAPGLKSMGVDIASGGKDETVIARFDGNMQLPFITLHTSDPDEIAARIAEEFSAGFTTAAIDETGAVGRMTPKLQRLGLKVYPVHFAAAPTNVYRTRYRRLGNARMEMYYHIAEELRAGSIRLINDDKLLAELCAPRLASNIERDVYYLEKKDRIRERLGRSPDRADATALARYALLLKDHSKIRMI